MYLYYILALVIILIDQVTKWIIDKNMEVYDSISVIDNFFYITSHRNEGAAWGILQGQMVFFYIITVIVVIGIIYYMQKYAKGNVPLSIGLGLILGGAIGNFIDRLIRKEVVDFLDFIIINYNFPIFNIADSALVVGVTIVLITTFFEEQKKGKIE